MIKFSRALLALVLAVGIVSCTDSTGPSPSPDGYPLLLAVVSPQSVSQAETNALSDAFDSVDNYHVRVVDELTSELIVETDIPLVPGGDAHVLDIDVPNSAFGRSVVITLIALRGGQELYRSVRTVLLQQNVDVQPVTLEIRYTGPGIRGAVTNEVGAGVGGVSVNLRDAADINTIAAATTEPDGTYLFVDVAPSSYRVVADPPLLLNVCPGFREVMVASTNAAVVANFGTSLDPCGTNVLVLSGGDFDDTGVVASMLANDPNLTVETFWHVNQLPGVDALRAFDVVLVFMNGLFDESAALGDQLAAYVGLGGNIVLGSFAWQGHSASGLGSTGWGALEGIAPLAPSPSGATYVAVNMDANSLVAHPLTVGLTAIGSPSGYSSGVSAVNGGNVVAFWDDLDPLIAWRTESGGQRIVGVSLFPAAGAAATGDVTTLWTNAVNWAGAAGGPAPVGGS